MSTTAANQLLLFRSRGHSGLSATLVYMQRSSCAAADSAALLVVIAFARATAASNARTSASKRLFGRTTIWRYFVLAGVENGGNSYRRSREHDKTVIGGLPLGDTFVGGKWEACFR